MLVIYLLALVYAIEVALQAGGVDCQVGGTCALGLELLLFGVVPVFLTWLLAGGYVVLLQRLQSRVRPSTPRPSRPRPRRIMTMTEQELIDLVTADPGDPDPIVRFIQPEPKGYLLAYDTETKTTKSRRARRKEQEQEKEQGQTQAPEAGLSDESRSTADHLATPS